MGELAGESQRDHQISEQLQEEAHARALTSRFGINPGPLKIVPESQRRHAPAHAFTNLGRCEAMLANGVWRCSRNAVEEVEGRHLCKQHARIAEAHGVS